MKVEFIYFDIGGVMTDWSRAFTTVTRKFNVPLADFWNLWNTIDDDITTGKIDVKELWKKATARFNIHEANNYDLLESWVNDYKPRTEVYQLIKLLKNHYKIGIISNLYKDMFPLLKKKGFVPDINYSSVILSCDVGLNKKRKEIFKLATDKSKFKPQEIMLIDDKKDFLKNAKGLGWNTFWFDVNDTKGSITKISQLLL